MDSPFRGVPFLLKDLGGWLAGVKVTRGSRFFADAPAVAADSEHVRRLKRADQWPVARKIEDALEQIPDPNTPEGRLFARGVVTIPAIIAAIAGLLLYFFFRRKRG